MEVHKDPNLSVLPSSSVVCRQEKIVLKAEKDTIMSYFCMLKGVFDLVDPEILGLLLPRFVVVCLPFQLLTQ